MDAWDLDNSNGTFILESGRMKKKYKGFIFDLDGTLLDSRQDIVEATNATILAMGGKALPEELIVSFVGTGVRPLIYKSLEKAIQNFNPEKTLEYFSKYYLEHCTDHSVFFPGAETFLKKLQQANLRAAVLTNKPQDYTDKILKNLNCESYFQIVLGTEAGFPTKPSPDVFFHVLKNLKLQVEEVLFVGDTEVDYQTAQNAGCDVALYTQGFTAKEQLSTFANESCFLFEHFDQLKDHI